VRGDTFDFAEYDAWRSSHEVTAVRVRVYSPPHHEGIFISYREDLIAQQGVSEEPVGNDPTGLGSASHGAEGVALAGDEAHA
jgi:hypothetical protein